MPEASHLRYWEYTERGEKRWWYVVPASAALAQRIANVIRTSRWYEDALAHRRFLSPLGFRRVNPGCASLTPPVPLSLPRCPCPPVHAEDPAPPRRDSGGRHPCPRRPRGRPPDTNPAAYSCEGRPLKPDPFTFYIADIKHGWEQGDLACRKPTHFRRSLLISRIVRSLKIKQINKNIHIWRNKKLIKVWNFSFGTDFFRNFTIANFNARSSCRGPASAQIQSRIGMWIGGRESGLGSMAHPGERHQIPPPPPPPPSSPPAEILIAASSVSLPPGGVAGGGPGGGVTVWIWHRVQSARKQIQRPNLDRSGACVSDAGPTSGQIGGGDLLTPLSNLSPAGYYIVNTMSCRIASLSHLGELCSIPLLLLEIVNVCQNGLLAMVRKITCQAHCKPDDSCWYDKVTCQNRQS